VFEVSGEIAVEALFGKREQRTGQIKFGHGLLRAIGIAKSVATTPSSTSATEGL
jgi:hypothetical protein